MTINMRAVCAIALFAGSTNIYAKQNASLEDYTCRQFLADVAKPDNGIKLLKSMMMIAWATGYASAHQQGAPRSDTRAFELISAALGDSCRKAPEQLATKAIVDSIDGIAK